MRYYCCFLIRQFEEINWIYWRDNVLMVIYMFPFVQFLILICDYQFVFKNWCIHVLNDEWHSTPATLVFSLCMAPCHSTWWFYWFVQGLTLGNIIWGYTHIGVCFSQRLSTLTEILGCATLSCWCDTISMRQFWWFFHTAKINQREGVACQNFMRHSLWIMRILASGKLFIGLNSRRFELYITTKPIWLYCQIQYCFISREI